MEISFGILSLVSSCNFAGEKGEKWEVWTKLEWNCERDITRLDKTYVKNGGMTRKLKFNRDGFVLRAPPETHSSFFFSCYLLFVRSPTFLRRSIHLNLRLSCRQTKSIIRNTIDFKNNIFYSARTNCLRLSKHFNQLFSNHIFTAQNNSNFPKSFLQSPSINQSIPTGIKKQLK